MFKILLSSIILLPITLLSANDSFAKKMEYSINYQQAKKDAITKYKPIMVVISTVTCPWCKKFENQTLKKENINTYIQVHFTPVKLIRDQDKYPTKLLNAKVVPTVFFVNPKTDQPFHISKGYKNKKDFFKQLEKAKSIYYDLGE